MRRLMAAAVAAVMACGLTAAGVVPGTATPVRADSTTDAALAAMVKPLYRARQPFGAQEKAILTTWSNDVDNAVNLWGYANDDVVAYISRAAGTGMVAVYCLYRTGVADRVYTTDSAEKASLLAAGGWADNGVVFYASPTSAVGMLPVYRLAKDGYHRYAVGDAERDASIAAGWTYEKVAFFGRGSFTTQLVTNGDFAAGTGGWNESDRLVESVSGGVLRADVSSTATAPRDAVAGQVDKTLVNGKTYTLSFDASASTSTTIRATIVEDADPFTEVFGADIDLATTPQHFSYTFDSTVDTSIGEVNFELGNGTAYSAYIDNVSLAKDDWTTSVAPRQTTEQALDAAASSGQLVEVLAERGESREVYATPQRTLVAVERPDPVRVLRSGVWWPVYDEVRVSGGLLKPFSSTVDLRLSNGGTTPLAQFTRDGHTITLTWPATLPVPTVETDPVTTARDTALYAGVLGPDVDLRVKATPNGFSHVLVVKTAAAAVDPRLASLTLGLSAPGLTIATADDGTQQAVDPVTGAVVFEAPKPLMWDSTVASTTNGGAPAMSARTLDAGDPGSAPPQTTATDSAPGDASKISTVSTSVSNNQITLTTDHAMMTASDTSFPVYIDPMYTTARSSANLMVASSGFELYNFTTDQGMGECPSGLPSSSRSCGSPHKKRLFYRIPTNWVAGKQVISAEFQVKEVWSASCSKRKVELWLATAFGKNSTWNTTSDNWTRRLDTRNEAKGWSSSCGGGDVIFNATSAVAEAARKGWSNTTFGLRATDESDQYAWKRFSRYAYLRVHYNTPPAQPKMSQLSSSPGGACQSTAVPINQLPTLYAKDLTDADNHGVEAEKLKAQFQVFWKDTNGVAQSRDLGTVAKVSAYNGRGTLFSVKIPSGMIPQNVTVGWQVRAWDGAAWSPWSSTGSATGCYLVYDTTAPAPPAISSTDYPAWDPANAAQTPTNGVGRYGRFNLTFGSQVTKFAWTLNAGAPSATAAIPKTAATMPVDVLPSGDGMNQLYTTAWDAAGNYATAVYLFNVAPGAAPKAQWKLDEPAGATTLADGAPKALGAASYPATPQGGYTLGVAGASGKAMALNGTTGYAATGGPVLDTSKSFTVAAWVKLPSSAGAAVRTIVGQDGSRVSAFMLESQPNNGKPVWCFRMATSDVDNASSDQACSADNTVQYDTWTHVAGVYDATTKQLLCYVNGQLARSAAHSSGWNAGGRLSIGRTLWTKNATPTSVDFFSGSIDDLRVFDRIVSAPEAAELSHTSVQVMGQWHLNSASAGSSADSNPEPSVPTRHPLSLAGGAQIVNGSVLTRTGQPDGMLYLPGGNGDYAAAAGAILKPTESFTLSVWVRTEGDPTRSQNILSLAGTNTSGLVLRYDGTTSRYTLDIRGQDTAGATAVTIQHPTFHGGDFGDWDHLAVTYDATDGQIGLWVNGDLSAAPDAEIRSTRFGVYPFATMSSLELGRAKVGGAWPTGQNFDGWLDDVWLVRGTPSADVVALLAVPNEIDNVHA